MLSSLAGVLGKHKVTDPAVQRFAEGRGLQGMGGLQGHGGLQGCRGLQGTGIFRA